MHRRRHGEAFACDERSEGQGRLIPPLAGDTVN